MAISTMEPAILGKRSLVSPARATHVWLRINCSLLALKLEMSFPVDPILLGAFV